MKLKTISDLTLTLLVDAGVFGHSAIEGKERVAYFNGKRYVRASFVKDGKIDDTPDEYEVNARAAFEEWKTTRGLTPRAAFAETMKKYGKAYPEWRSPHGRLIPDKTGVHGEHKELDPSDGSIRVVKRVVLGDFHRYDDEALAMLKTEGII